MYTIATMNVTAYITIKSSITREDGPKNENIPNDIMIDCKRHSAEDTIREDVKLLRDASWFKGMQILGFVQDTKTGILNEVVGA